MQQKAKNLEQNIARLVLDAVRHPVILVDKDNSIAYANADA
ncbi:two-component sensor histidine kinase, partial [Bartonella sp. M0193]|nr:two-component sensor histidine kinase [Bartonella sp. M0193]